MADSQNELIELLQQGKFLEESSVPRHIETVISHVFVFPTKAYKFYKTNNYEFNDGFRNLADQRERFLFTQKDFEWNKALSPSIYLELIPVTVRDGLVQRVDLDAADELLFDMKTIDLKDVLYERIVDGRIDEHVAFFIGKELAQTLKKVRSPLTDTYDYYTLFDDRIRDAVSWLKLAEKHIPTKEAQSYVQFLRDFKEYYRDLFKGELSNEITYNGDIHSFNALLTNNEFFLMDTYPPKEEWMIEHHSTALYRIATDILVLTGDWKLFDACLAGYEEGYGSKINRTLDPFFIFYAGSLACAYFYMLADADASKAASAQKYHAFMTAYLTEQESNIPKQDS